MNDAAISFEFNLLPNAPRTPAANIDCDFEEAGKVRGTSQSRCSRKLDFNARISRFNSLHISKFVKIIADRVDQGELKVFIRSNPMWLVTKTDPEHSKEFLQRCLFDSVHYDLFTEIGLEIYNTRFGNMTSDVSSIITFYAFSEEEYRYKITDCFYHYMPSFIAMECSLNKVEEKVLALKHLIFLDLSGNNLTALPDGLVSMPSLKFLVLKGNKIKTISNLTCSTESQLSRNLKTLVLSNNNLTFLPYDIYNLQNLRCLDVAYNRIKELPQNMGHLKKLETLYLEDNRLHYLPHSFFDFPSLKDCDLSDNNIGNEFTFKFKPSEKLSLPTLFDNAARVIRKHNITWRDARLSERTIAYIDNVTECPCSRLFYDPYACFATEYYSKCFSFKVNLDSIDVVCLTKTCDETCEKYMSSL